MTTSKWSGPPNGPNKKPHTAATVQGSRVQNIAWASTRKNTVSAVLSVGVSQPVQLLLSRLQGVKRSGRGYVAICPAHEDRNASLSVGEAPTGAALIHCHACCSTDAVLGAIGLAPSDLFPPRPEHCSDRRLSAEALAERRVWSIAALLPVLVEETTILQIACADLVNGKPMTPEHYARLKLAEQRIEDALATLRPKLRDVSP